MIARAKALGCNGGGPSKTEEKLSPYFGAFGIFEGAPSRSPMPPGLFSTGGRVELPKRSSRLECPSVRRMRADCGGPLLPAKLRIVMLYPLHQLLDHSLAYEPVLLAGQFRNGLGDGVDDFVGFSVLQRQIERGKHETTIAVAQLRERWG